MANQSTQATIFTAIHPDIVKRTNVGSMSISVVMLVIGFASFFSAFQLDDKSSSISMLLMVLGTALLLMGVFRIFWKSKEMVYMPTGSAAKEQSLFFDTRYAGTISELLKAGSFQTDDVIKSAHSGNIRLDVILSQDSKFAAVQLFQFVPYTYDPVTPVYYFVGEQASAFAAYLQKSKMK